ncbi:asparagine synthase-related protein [Streptomyces sp. MS19]|uniref:asparagine synthase-related protein n=1 Tax=Streptomyces sp. MS19 TaxID=3385972 RepID=UPI0039A2E9C7
MPVPSAEWFAVLPGRHPAAPRARRALEAADPGSGLLGRLGRDIVVVGRAARPLSMANGRDVGVMLCGDHDASAGELTRAAGLISRGHAPEDALTGFSGCYHAIAVVAGGSWVAGDVAGIRQAFTARIDGCPVVGSDAAVLAGALGDGRPDTGFLASALLSPAAPLALSESGASAFTRVSSVPPGSSVRIDGDGRITSRKWWTPPDDELPVREAATALRAALKRAVAVRVPDRGTVGCELSGGMDSTSLASIAYGQCGARVELFTRGAAADPTDDVHWAELAAAAMPEARHHLAGPEAIAAPLDGLGDVLPMDAPGPTGLSPRRSVGWWRTVARTGARLLLSGKGGDEVMLTALPYLHHTRRRNRLVARAHLAGWAALWNAPPARLRAQAAHPGPYERWLALSLSPRRRGTPGWEAPPTLPRWLSQQGRDALQQALAQAGPLPLHDRPHQHTAVAAVRALARLNRLQAAAALARTDLRIGYPFADRQVIEAVLGCRAEERTSPFEVRPLLRAAMRGIVPDVSLTRRTKGGYGAGDDLAARQHRRAAVELLEGSSVLVELGLVDPGPLTAPLAQWGAGGPDDLLVALTLQAEVWARGALGRHLHSREDG